MGEVSELKSDERGKSPVLLLAVTLAATAAAGAVAALIVRDQMARHRRDLFNSHTLQRLAALGYLAGRPASVDHITLLRDFISWEPRWLLRRRAAAILRRMEEEAEGRGVPGLPSEGV